MKDHIAKLKRYKIETELIPSIERLQKIVGLSTEKDAVNAILRWAFCVGDLDDVTQIRLEAALSSISGRTIYAETKPTKENLLDEAKALSRQASYEHDFLELREPSEKIQNRRSAFYEKVKRAIEKKVLDEAEGAFIRQAILIDG